MRRHLLRICPNNSWKSVLIYFLAVVSFFAIVAIVVNYVTSTQLKQVKTSSDLSEMNSPEFFFSEMFPEVTEFMLDQKISKFDNEDARVLGFANQFHHVSPSNASSTKLIFLATPYFNQWNAKHYYSLHLGNDTFRRYSCPNPNCRVTKDAADLEKADAVLFHLRDLEVFSVPQQRAPHQVWILYSMEPPWLEIRDMRRYDDVFNWTMSYRRGSDLLVKYGFIGKRSNRNAFIQKEDVIWKRSVIKEKSNRSKDTITVQKNDIKMNYNVFFQKNNKDNKGNSSVDRHNTAALHRINLPKQNSVAAKTTDTTLEENLTKNAMTLTRQKKNRAVWLVSNCQTDSNREGYVSRLKKTYPVDVFGGCGKEACRPAETTKCYSRIARRYKFYLAFENALCRDYVTEKLFNSLEFDIVPVVLGGANYRALVPEHSVIEAMDFGSPEDLGMYLWQVSRNDDLYRSYFWWKDSFRSYLQPWMCDLCAKLHEQSSTRAKSRDELEDWWNEGGSCKRWTKDGFQISQQNVFPVYHTKIFAS